jgi:hypothetical protein
VPYLLRERADIPVIGSRLTPSIRSTRRGGGDRDVRLPYPPASEKALASAAKRNISDIARLELLIVCETEKWTRKTFRCQPIAVPMVIGREQAPHVQLYSHVRV